MKKKRQAEILRIISSNEVETQEMLLNLLKQKGYDVTYGIASRFLRNRLPSVLPSEADGTRQYNIWSIYPISRHPHQRGGGVAHLRPYLPRPGTEDPFQ